MNPEKVLEEIEEMAGTPPTWGKHHPKTSFLPIIGREKGAVLEKLVQENQPKLILEIGTLIGYSAILMGMHLKKGRIISLEIDLQAADRARKNIEKAGLSAKVEIITGDAQETIPRLKGMFDMVFLDAAKSVYLPCLKLVEGKLSPEAVIVADNVKMFAQEMQDYLEYVRNSGKYKSKTVDFGFDAVEVSRLVEGK